MTWPKGSSASRRRTRRQPAERPRRARPTATDATALWLSMRVVFPSVVSLPPGGRGSDRGFGPRLGDEEAFDECLCLPGVDSVGVVEALADAVPAEGVDRDDLVALRKQHRPSGVTEAGAAAVVGPGCRRDEEAA